MSQEQLQPVAVCVVDIHDAGELWHELDEEMATAIGTFDQRMDELLAEHSGARVEAVEAECVARFAELEQAVEFALALQEALLDGDWPHAAAGSGPHTAAGVDIGVLDTRTSARTGRELVSGASVRSAARLAHDVPAGTVGVSPAAQDLLDESTTDVGSSLAERIHEHKRLSVIVPARLQESVSDEERLAEDGHAALPEFGGAFVNRVREFGALATAFDEGARYVALCGSAGAGKSRLAVEFARKWYEQRRREGARAWFCDLTEVDTVVEALFSVARATGVQIPSSETVEALEHALTSAFSGRDPILLILDDIDHLAGELDESVERWLGRADNVRVIATRQRMPDGQVRSISVEALGEASARALLEDRIRYPVGPAYEPDDPVQINRVVQQSGRLPLALELLAGTVRHSAMRRLDEPLGTIEPTKHNELEEAMQRSWQLLDSFEQSALAACTVFAGSFTEEAALAVIDAAIESSVDASDLLASLRQCSLLRADSRAGDGVRLILLAPVRDFVASCAEDEVVSAAVDAFVDYFTGWAEALRAGLRADNEAAWIDRARVEFANLSRAAELGREAALASCLTILEGLGELDIRIGPLGGFRERADSVVRAARDEEDPELLFRALWLRAERLIWTGQYEASEADYREALEIARELDDEVKVAITLCGVGFALGMRGHEEQALPRVRKAVGMLRDSQAYEVISALNSASVIARSRGQMDEAIEYHHRALVRARRINNAFGEASALFLLGTSLRRDQQWQEAIRCLEEAGELFLSIGDRRGRLVSYHELAECYSATEQVESAERCYSEAMALASDIGDSEYSGVFLLGRGRSRFTRGDYARAESDLLEASIDVDEVGHVYLKIAVKMYLGATYAALDRIAEARTYFERVEQIFEETDVIRSKPVHEVLQGYLDASRARAALRDGDEGAAIEHVKKAYARSDVQPDGDTSTPREVYREADRLRSYLDERVESGELPAGASPSRAVLRVSKDLRWFAVDDDEPVDISRRGAIRRILRALVEKRLAEPDEPMDVHELLEAGWPDEAPVAKSGQQRTYMAISRLRGLGLEGVLTTVDEGYLIDPSYTPVWVERSA